jgi:nicotinate-nucleotide pyrophosphorylase (carboxylating)
MCDDLRMLGAVTERTTHTLDRDTIDLVARAVAEDLGSGDVTSTATVDESVRAHARIFQKAPGVVFGIAVAEAVFLHIDPALEVTATGPEGEWRDDGPVMEITGSARAVLAAERTALNFLQQLSGVATLTARCVRAVEGTGATILDTRKTTPGLRTLQKQAVLAGGGSNHRIGLFDMVLIKENHAALAGGIGAAVRRARTLAPDVPLEVECENLSEVDEALDAGATQILLDNMDPEQLRAAVERVAGRAELEASGGFTLDTIGAVAASGVDFISVGALTHSAPALDLSLLLELQP